MQEGLLLPLDDMLTTDALDEKVPFKDVFNPGTLDLYAKDGVHFLMPYDDSPVMFWYNNRPSNPINSVQSTYLWTYSKMNQYPPEDTGMPAIGAFQMAQLRDPEITLYNCIVRPTREKAADTQREFED
jgi:hypothetical protein